MGMLRKLWAYVAVLGSARRHRWDLLRWLGRRPQLLLGTVAYETGLLCSGRVDPRLKVLAELKTAALVHCEFCLDIGSALAPHLRIDERQLRDLADFRSSEAYDEAETLVLALAEAMTRTPVGVDDDLRSRLAEQFSPSQLTELVSCIAWENQRARLNQALGVRPAGFSDDRVCALPQPIGDDEGSEGRQVGPT